MVSGMKKTEFSSVTEGDSIRTKAKNGISLVRPAADLFDSTFPNADSTTDPRFRAD